MTRSEARPPASRGDPHAYLAPLSSSHLVVICCLRLFQHLLQRPKTLSPGRKAAPGTRAETAWHCRGAASALGCCQQVVRPGRAQVVEDPGAAQGQRPGRRRHVPPGTGVLLAGGLSQRCPHLRGTRKQFPRRPFSRPRPLLARALLRGPADKVRGPVHISHPDERGEWRVGLGSGLQAGRNGVLRGELRRCHPGIPGNPGGLSQSGD